MSFYGKIGLFAELPRPDEIYDYEKFQKPDWVLGIKDDVKKEDTDNKKSFKFT